MSPLLSTPRLLLRPFEPAHEEALFLLWNEPQVRLYLWDDQPVPREVVAEQVALSSRSFQQSGYGLFALFLREQPERLVGFCGLRRIDDSEDVELLYGLHPEVWGRGLAVEASRAVLREGFERAGLEEIFAGADEGNARSFRTMERLGMHLRGERRVGPQRLPARYASIRHEDLDMGAA